jgi:hypothetical protein
MMKLLLPHLRLVPEVFLTWLGRIHGMGKLVKSTSPAPSIRATWLALQKQGIRVSTTATAEEARRLMAWAPVAFRVFGLQVRDVQEPQPGDPLAADQARQAGKEVESAGGAFEGYGQL